MSKKRLFPVQKIEPDKINIGEEIEVHPSRLASFKATVSRINKDLKDGCKLAFNYTFKSDYFIVTRVTDK